MKQSLVTAATAWAVAAASLLCATQATAGLCYGLSIARSGETWLQRVLPGKIPVFTIYSPELHTERYMRDSDHFAYIAPTWGSFESFQLYLLSMAILAIPLMGVHLLACLLVMWPWRKKMESAAPEVQTLVESAPQASLVRRASPAVFVGVMTWIVLMCLWGGADRGTVTQSHVGGEIVDVAYGPFGRFALLLAAVSAYLFIFSLAARSLRKRNAESSGFKAPFIARRGTLTVLVAIFTVFATFPYWIKQVRCIVGDDAAKSVERWSYKTSMRDVLDSLSPIPQSKCAPLPDELAEQ